MFLKTPVGKEDFKPEVLEKFKKNSIFYQFKPQKELSALKIFWSISLKFEYPKIHQFKFKSRQF
jgi:hypothetical protein